MYDIYVRNTDSINAELAYRRALLGDRTHQPVRRGHWWHRSAAKAAR